MPVDSNPNSYFPTPSAIAATIASVYSNLRLQHVVDLGCGAGNLVLPFDAAASIQSPLHLTAYDIDLSRFEMDAIQHSTIDLRELNLEKHSATLDAGIDIPSDKTLIVSNPPFGNTKATHRHLISLRKHGLIGNALRQTIRLELLFLARALDLAKPRTHICFVVPLTFLTARQFKSARTQLIDRHGMVSCRIYQPSEFKKTEVQVAVIHFRAQAGIRSTVTLIDDETGNEIKVSRQRFVNGSLPHAGNITQKDVNVIRLKDLEIELSRGKECAKRLSEQGVMYIHSSHINRSHTGFVSGDPTYCGKENADQLAHKGDILISRVGTRCLGKVVMVRSGAIQISDSVIRLRSDPADAKKIFRQLISEKTQAYLNKHATGACAKILTYDLLKQLPIAS